MLRLGRAPEPIGEAKAQDDRRDRQAGISGRPAVAVDPKEFGHFETEGREGRGAPAAMYRSMP